MAAKLTMRTWVDASTLIALDLARELTILHRLLGQVAITEEVRTEVFGGKESRVLREALGDWIQVLPVKGDLRKWATLGLGPGEASLFLTPRGDRLVIDDAPARTVAESEGREYTGLLGLLLAGANARNITAPDARRVLGALVRTGFHVASHLYDEMTRELGV